MSKVKSILTDAAIDLIILIREIIGNVTAQKIVEDALREYLRELRRQGEYQETK